VLLTGESGVGKSELALELITRGGGLVADDVVELYHIAPETLEGRCPELLRDFLEVRGLGMLNIRTIFGETAVRVRKNLKLIVQLEKPVGGVIPGLERLPLEASSEGRVLTMDDMRTDSRLKLGPLVQRYGYRSFLGVPLRRGARRRGSILNENATICLSRRDFKSKSVQCIRRGYGSAIAAAHCKDHTSRVVKSLIARLADRSPTDACARPDGDSGNRCRPGFDRSCRQRVGGVVSARRQIEDDSSDAARGVIRSPRHGRRAHHAGHFAGRRCGQLQSME
jgi:hypothetical protein